MTSWQVAQASQVSCLLPLTDSWESSWNLVFHETTRKPILKIIPRHLACGVSDSYQGHHTPDLLQLWGDNTIEAHEGFGVVKSQRHHLDQHSQHKRHQKSCCRRQLLGMWTVTTEPGASETRKRHCCEAPAAAMGKCPPPHTHTHIHCSSWTSPGLNSVSPLPNPSPHGAVSRPAHGGTTNSCFFPGPGSLVLHLQYSPH